MSNNDIKITEPGVYQTRGGGTGPVKYVDHDEGIAFGYVDGTPTAWYTNTGKHAVELGNRPDPSCDIVARVEDKPVAEPETRHEDLTVDQSRDMPGFWVFYTSVDADASGLHTAPTYSAFIGYVWDDGGNEVINNRPLMYRDAGGGLWDTYTPNRTPVRPRAVRWKKS